jgi:hypothetical protein
MEPKNSSHPATDIWSEPTSRDGLLSTREAPREIAIAFTTPDNDCDAVEIRILLPKEDGTHHHHVVRIARTSLTFLIEELEVHRHGGCTACAAQTFAARLTDVARSSKHTCPPASKAIP